MSVFHIYLKAAELGEGVGARGVGGGGRGRDHESYQLTRGDHCKVIKAEGGSIKVRRI